jgi:hypothetical protein
MTRHQFYRREVERKKLPEIERDGEGNLIKREEDSFCSESLCFTDVERRKKFQ